MARTWSDDQKDIYAWHDSRVSTGEPAALLVQAGPGSGKTTTLEEAIKNHVGDGVNAACMAFGKDIATVMQARLPNREVRTFHSHGLKVLRKAFTHVDVEKNKDYLILENLLNRTSYGHLYYPISQLAAAVKNNLAETDDATLMGLAVDFNVDIFNNDVNLILNTTRKLLAENLRMTSTLSFDDMIYLPIALDIPIPKLDYLAVDEWQDLNIAQMELMSRSVTDNGVIVGVGDRHQSIYRFRGADQESMDKFKRKFHADELPLHITYRCPKSVVAALNAEFPDSVLVAHENNIEGMIDTLDIGKTDFQPGDMILCRINAALVEPCYSLIRKGIKATIKGKNIGEGLVSLVKRMKARNVPDLIDKLEMFHSQEVYKLLSQKKDYAAQALTDKVETIYAIISTVDIQSSVFDVIGAIYNIFSDGTPAVQFSSIHKAKGLEADNVYILKPELLPHPRATKPEEIEQERNLKYVAMSRTKQQLVYVTGVR